MISQYDFYDNMNSWNEETENWKPSVVSESGKNGKQMLLCLWFVATVLGLPLSISKRQIQTTTTHCYGELFHLTQTD